MSRATLFCTSVRSDSLKFRHFAEIKVTIPDETGQKAIAKVFRTVGHELDLLQAKAGALRDQKEGLMQQLLTGKERVQLSNQGGTMSGRRKPRISFAYDFDGTLSPGNMQEYDFIPQLNMKSKAFWREVGKWARDNEADEILAYMNMMLRKADQAEVRVLRQSFRDFGRAVELYPGVEDWFDRVNAISKEHGLKPEHYILSSGLKEMIEGTAIAAKFERIYASSFAYDQHDVAKWVAMAINYTTKTQFLFRINKGALDVWDNTKINEYVREEERPVPFANMVYIGDGSTDVPCMKLVRDQGGHSIAVYRPHSSLDTVRKLLEDDRVNFAAPADFTPGSRLEKIARQVISGVAAREQLKKLAKENPV